MNIPHSRPRLEEVATPQLLGQALHERRRRHLQRLDALHVPRGDTGAPQARAVDGGHTPAVRNAWSGRFLVVELLD